MPTSHELLQQAKEYFNTGQLAKAKSTCLRHPDLEPDDPESLYLLGSIEFQKGNTGQAAKFLDRAIAADPDNAAWLADRCAIEEQAGKPALALTSIDAALVLEPANALFLMRRAVLLQLLGRFYESLMNFTRVLELEPENRNALMQKGRLLLRFEEFEESAGCCRRLLELDGSDTEARSLLGNALVALGRLDEALANYEQLLDLMPENASEWYNCGNVLSQLWRYDEALSCYEKALGLNPDHADAWYNRGNVLYGLKRYDEALLCFERTVAIDPGYRMAWLNRGNAQLVLYRPKEALGSFDRALQIDPNYAEAWMNRGNALGDLGRYHEASESCARALQLRPDYAEAGFNLALLALRTGNFSDGWRLYEWRWSQKAWLRDRRNFKEPLWLGETPIEGRRILLYSEQGLGDTIQFCRYVSEVAALGATVILEVQPPLAQLLGRLQGVSHVAATGDGLPTFDVRCPLLSLPLAFGTSTAYTSSCEPYLMAEQKKKEEWKKRLGTKNKPRIGLVWNGNTLHTNDRRRSIAAGDFLPHLPEGFEYVSLQKELRPGDEEAIRQAGILHFGEKLHNFSDTAALCSVMDIIICVDTSVAHLAAALGMPTWIMLPFVPDWRWMLDREDSPWYASARLFRQPALGDWTNVLKRISEELLQKEWQA
jgi:tetratricopeptide (TPR) repeat protein